MAILMAFKINNIVFHWNDEYHDYTADLNGVELAVGRLGRSSRYAFWYDSEVSPNHIQASSIEQATEKILTDPWFLERASQPL